MPEFLSPEVVVEEVSANVKFPKRTSPNVTAAIGTATRGPINRIQSVSSLEDFVAIYGKDDGGYLYQSAVGFFGNGGERMFVNRIAHYSDITDTSTLTAVAASTTLLTEGDTDTPAVKTTSIAGPWDFSPEAGVTQPPTLIAAIDGNPGDTCQVDVTPSVLTAAGNFVGAATVGTTAIFRIHGVEVTYTTPNPAPTTKEALALDLAKQLPGVYGGLATNKLRLTTHNKGSAMDLDYVSSTGDFGAQSGFGAGPTSGVNAGPNDVANYKSIQPSELATLIQADWSSGGGVTAVAVGDDTKVTTNTVGSSGKIGAVTGTAAAVVGFLEAGLVSGIDAGSPGVDSILVTATSEGEHGNTLAITTKRVDKVVCYINEDMPVAGAPYTSALVTSKSQLRVGLQIYVEDSTTGGTFRAVVKQMIGNRVYFKDSVTPTGNIVQANEPSVTKETFNLSVIVDGAVDKSYFDLSMSSLDVVKYFEYVIGTDPTVMDPTLRVYVQDQEPPLSNTLDLRPVDATNQILTGGIDSDPVVNADYIGSDTTDTGLHAFDMERSISLLMIPGVENAEVHSAIEDYVESRKDLVGMIDAVPGQTPTQIVNYKNVTANIFSTYMIMNCGRLRVRRASTGQIEEFPTLGYVLGMFARNDRNYSISDAPAGTKKGRLSGVLDIANNNEYGNKSKRDIIYPEGINPVYSVDGVGPVYAGQNLTNNLAEINVIGVRRAFIFIRKTVMGLAESVMWEKNTSPTRKTFVSIVTGFLSEQWRKGVLDGATEAQAFNVKCDESNNPPQLIEAKGFYARISLHILPGAENVLIEVEKTNMSLLQEVA